MSALIGEFSFLSTGVVDLQHAYKGTIVNLGGPAVCQQNMAGDVQRHRIGCRNSDYIIIPVKRVMIVEGRV